MVKLNLHALYSGLTIVHTPIVLCICQQQTEFVRLITVDRYFFAIYVNKWKGCVCLYKVATEF